MYIYIFSAVQQMLYIFSEILATIISMPSDLSLLCTMKQNCIFYNHLNEYKQS